MRVLAIIQARMGSTRLPGKVIRPLAGRPMLVHIIERIKRCRFVDGIILATSDLAEDQQLLELGRQTGIGFFAGSEDDVLARYYLAAREFGADHIVRVTGDNPLTDPQCIDLLIERQLQSNSDYGYVHGLPLGTAAEIIFFGALEAAYKEGHQQPHREHVTVYVKENPHRFKILNVEAPVELRSPGIRLTVDTPEDMELMEEIYQRLYRPGEVVSLTEVITLLKETPELAKKNEQVSQKLVRDKKLIIRADGGVKIGMGHIFRMLTLAEALVVRKPVEIIFATRDYHEATDKIREAGYRFIPLPKTCTVQEELQILSDIVHRDKPHAIILDILDTDQTYIKMLQHMGQRVISFDNAAVPSDLPDLTFNALVEKDYQYLIFSEKIANLAKKEREISPQLNKLLITMGGSDPAGLTIKTLKLLLNMNHDMEIDVVVGPAFSWDYELRMLLDDKHHKSTVKVIRGISDMSWLMWAADAAVCSAGLTMFELAALGTPSIVLSQHEDQKINADYMETKGAIINMGVGSKVSDAWLQEALQKLITDYDCRAALSQRARKTLDGQGTRRVVDQISDLLYGKGNIHGD